MMFSKIRNVLALPVVALFTTGAYAAAVDISTDVATFVTDAGTYFGYVLVGILALVGFHICVRFIKKMART